MAINVLATVEALQQTLSDAANQSLDRRFGALYDKIYRKDVLWDAWRQVRSKRGGPGIDGETIEYIEEEIGVPVFLQELRDQLKSQSYRPQPVKRVEIPKPDGGVRKLGIPSAVDRVVQQAILLVLSPQWDETH